MAFCNSCGANITPGMRFCNRCGAAILASSPASAAAAGSSPVPAPPASAAAAVSPQGPRGGALKSILVIVGVLVLVGILAVTSLAFLAWRVARHAHVRHNGNNVKVETPFGNVESTNDPQAAARDLGVDPYPGAQALKEGASSASFGSVHTASVNFETSDSVEKVCTFYKSKFPNAMAVTAQADQCSIVSNDQKNMITITVKGEPDRTRIVITNVNKSGAASSSSN